MNKNQVKLLAAFLLLSGAALFGCSERKEQPAPAPQQAAPAVEAAAPAAEQEEAAVADEAQEIAAADLEAGRELYERHCSACHPNGGNIINRDKTLQYASLEASGLTDPQAFVAYLRSPGAGMPTFSAAALPDEKAMQIAWYTLETFK